MELHGNLSIDPRVKTALGGYLGMDNQTVRVNLQIVGDHPPIECIKLYLQSTQDELSSLEKFWETADLPLIDGWLWIKRPSDSLITYTGLVDVGKTCD